MTDSLASLLLRRSAAGPGAVLWGRDAAPHFGPAFDRLLADGVLTERAPATIWGSCRACDCAARARPVVEIGGQLVAECPDDATASIVLAPHEIRSFAIDAGALVATLAAASGLSGAPEPLAEGVWHLGHLADGRAVVLVSDEAAARDPGLLAVLRGAVAPAATTLLLPEGVPPAMGRRLRDAGCHLVAAAEALDGSGLRLRRAALAPPSIGSARLVIHRAGRTVALDGRPVPMTDQPFRLLLALAETARRHAGYLEPKDIQAAVYGRLSPPEARELRDLPRVLKDALAAGLSGPEAKAVRALIQNRRPGGYRLALPPAAIAIED